MLSAATFSVRKISSQSLAAAVPAYGALTYSTVAKGGQQWTLPHVGDGNGGGRFQFRSGGDR